MKRKTKFYLFTVVLALLTTSIFTGCFFSSSKKYTLEQSYASNTFQGTFELDFSGHTPYYKYTGNDIDAYCDMGMIAVSIYGEIEKEGYMYDCGEKRNGKTKYMPSGMDYYLWLSDDESYLTYGGYTFTN